MADIRLRACHIMLRISASYGLNTGAYSSSPIFAVAANSVRIGTRPACGRAKSSRMTIWPQRLACKGGSNGGLLVGNMLTRYPDLFGAIDCAVPLLDMKRYTKLTAGASWISEYGDPENPED